MNARDTMALLGYAEMLDDTVDLRNDSHSMNGGEPVRILMNEVHRLEVEIVRLKIAHLRRMVESIRLVLDRHLISATTESEYERKKWRRNDRAGRFAKACLAKITELKESQCLTKS